MADKRSWAGLVAGVAAGRRGVAFKIGHSAAGSVICADHRGNTMPVTLIVPSISREPERQSQTAVVEPQLAASSWILRLAHDSPDVSRPADY